MYKIGDFSKCVDVPVKTLRYYDEIDLFKPSFTDTWSGYRYYEDFQIDEIKKIMMLKELNLSLKEIKEFMETSDINIIEDKGEEFRLKMEAIKNYTSDVNYEIIKGDYDEYIKWNGLKSSSHPQALELRDKAAAYYVILKNGKFFKDFYVYFETNNATSLIRLWVHEDLFAYCIDYLSKEYDTLVLASFEEHDVSNIIKRYCTILKEVEKEYRYFDGRMFKYIEYTVSLKKND